MKKILAIIFISLLCMSFLMAQQNKYETSNEEVKQILIKTQENFEEKNSFECPGECVYGEKTQERTRLKVRQTNKFLFIFDVNVEEEYELDEEGNVKQVKYNFWSWILNRERLKVGDN